MSTNVTLPDKLSFLRTFGPIAGVAGLVVGAVLAMVIDDLSLFFEAGLYSFLLVLSLSTGSMALLMIHHMTGGAWSFVSQRIFEAAMRTLPVLFVGWVVFVLSAAFFGPNTLYDAWMVEEGRSHIVENKAMYLDKGFWALRGFLFFGIWGAITVAFTRWSRRLDETGDALITLKFRFWAPVGLIVYCLTTTFAALDWGMSLEPEWFSTMYGPLFWISQALTVFAFTTLILSSLAEEKSISRYITSSHYHMLGSLMCGFVVLWTYMSFAQYLIIWSGNLPEEIHYYLRRSSTFYQIVTLALMIGHFFIPFFVLLMRSWKYNIARLRKVCFWILGFRLVDMFFVLNPAFHEEAAGVPIGDMIVYLAVLVGFGGFYLWYFLGKLAERPLLPLNDPRFYDAVTHVEAPGEGEEAMDHA